MSELKGPGTLLSEFDFWGWCERGEGGVRGVRIGDSDTPHSSLATVSTDTRTITDGALFVALTGDRFDGHRFLTQAHSQGAAAAFVSRVPDDAPAGLILIEVEDTLLALQQLAAALWQDALTRGIKTISLTGSNGKTTTKELLRALFSSRYRVHATHGNFNNHIGMPLTICATPLDAQVIIVEMGASKPRDIEELTLIAPAHGRLITSIGHAHLEGMGGIDGVRRTKREIFIGSDAQTVAVVPASEAEHLLEEGLLAHTYTFSTTQSASVRARLRELTVTGMWIELKGDVSADRVHVGLHGEHNVSNVAACVALMHGMGEEGLDNAFLTRALEGLDVPGGRGRVVEAGAWTFLDDSYNANPTSVMASFDAFLWWNQSNGRLDEEVIAVLGEMKEMGEETKAWHERTAKDIVERGEIDTLVCVGPFAKAMEEVSSGLNEPIQVVACDDVEDVARWLTTRRGGVIFLKASRGARLERLIEIIQEG